MLTSMPTMCAIGVGAEIRPLALAHQPVLLALANEHVVLVLRDNAAVRHENYAVALCQVLRIGALHALRQIIESLYFDVVGHEQHGLVGEQSFDGVTEHVVGH